MDGCKSSLSGVMDVSGLFGLIYITHISNYVYY